MALIGLGAMGTRHARIVSALDDRFELARAYDVDRAAPTPGGAVQCASEAEALLAEGFT